MTKKVIVVGAGPAGMMAAVRAAELGSAVQLYEKNSRPGQKLELTGNRRGNITNFTKRDDFFLHYGKNGRFLANSFSRFFNKDLIKFFASKGVDTVTEADGRVFPASGNTQHVVQCLVQYLEENRVVLIRNCQVQEVLVENKRVVGIRSTRGTVHCDSVILATGGLSYPQTGSSGDGYIIARKLGHKVTTLRPAMVPLVVKGNTLRKLQGVSLKDAVLTVFLNDRRIAQASGGIVLTHYGISGPAALALSKKVAQHLDAGEITAHLNLTPGLFEPELNNRVNSLFLQYRGAGVGKALRQIVPSRLALFLIRSVGIDENRKCSDISRTERKLLIGALRSFRLAIKSTRPIQEAMVTSGGVSLKEINPATMESKIVKGLFFCGELIDLDGDSGGYNLQAAFSTGYLAGENAATI